MMSSAPNPRSVQISAKALRSIDCSAAREPQQHRALHQPADRHPSAVRFERNGNGEKDDGRWSGAGPRALELPVCKSAAPPEAASAADRTRQKRPRAKARPNRPSRDQAASRSRESPAAALATGSTNDASASQPWNGSPGSSSILTRRGASEKGRKKQQRKKAVRRACSCE